MTRYLLALDQGTTSSRAILFDREGNILRMAQKEFKQIYPEPGWVEHDPMEIWATQIGVAGEVLARESCNKKNIAAIGITNQRETTIVWDKNTGVPVYNAIVWQCKRTRQMCEDLKERGYADWFRQKTGLVVDSYFSATKLQWILDEVPGVRKRAEDGDLLFGTVDTWLLWKLTSGEVHATDVSNASRTMLFNIHTRRWDEEILSLLDIPQAMLPTVTDSAFVQGTAHDHGYGLMDIPIASLIGDQQGALFGQRCFKAGRVKNTYGTGCFLLMNVGKKPVESHQGLLSTIAWGIDGEVTYALEGSIFMAGAIIQWLRDELGLLETSSQSDAMARSVSDNGGVYLVPAFTGLGAPYWDMDARGTILGLTRGSNKNHLVRAGLEAIAYQTKDVLDVMINESQVALDALYVDGGAVANDFLMSFQSDILATPVVRPRVVESTAFGAAALAGLAVGFYQNLESLEGIVDIERRFEPQMGQKQIDFFHGQWQRAVARSRHWIDRKEN